MSVNPISPETLWWTPRHQQKHHPLMISASNSKSLTFANHFSNYNLNLNHTNHNDDRGRRAEVVNILSNGGLQQQQLEVMFEKPLTPSDVGKLNRLVIPKQHAERHLPLNTSNGADSGGILLSFEDEAGKFWRFRYSYWNSSQSYVLTKGWSRYVKEKQLDTGDVVLFKRHPTDPDRLFIAWRRRHDPAQMELSNTSAVAACSSAVSCKEFYPAHHHQAYNVHLYRPDTEASAAGVNQSRSFNWSSSSRTLRLFGVNMECQFESDQLEPANPDGSSMSSPRRQQVQQNASHSQHRR